MTCAEIAERGLIERYVAGTLSADESAALEGHYVGCAHCQTELRLAMAVRSAVREAGPVAQRAPARRWMVGAGLAMAAGVAGLLLLRPARLSTEWQDLAAVPVAPIYLGVEVRGAPALGDSLFTAAMTAYGERRYADAARALQDALDAGADPAPASFFLGAAHLMLDRSREARGAFDKVIALGDTPYLAESRLYRAKALLREGQASQALSDLRATAAMGSTVSEWAQALADSVAGRIPR